MKSNPNSLALGIALACLAIALSPAVRAQAQTFTTLGNFTGFNGAYPSFGSMIQATNGNYYGSTLYGGKNKDYGAVFQLTASGKLSTLYTFCSLSGCSDGAFPEVAPILGSDRNFYGTTTSGGNSINAGTVYKMTIGGK